MEEVKRYGRHDSRLEQEPNGVFVIYEDYQSLTSERNRLREALLKIRKAFEIIGENSVITAIDKALKESEGNSG